MSATQENEKMIFETALELKTDAERTTYLDKVCGFNLTLKARIMALLQARDGGGDYLETLMKDPGFSVEENVLEKPGTIISRYKLLEKIGEGGMAVVYMAEQQEPIRRKVALKIIKLGMDTKSVIARFEAERQALAMMDHPNIAKVLDAGATETGRPYFVMELVTGVSITEYSDKNNLSTKERLSLFIQVCNAVQHAHQKGIIHRDIKPTNVLVTRHHGRPITKIIDFGIAKAINQKLTEKTLFTRYAHIIGTPTYMSPEQAELSDLDIDTRTDIYSLGVLLYELLTGTTPFGEEELRKAGYIEMQRIIREQEPTKPSTKLSTLGKTLTDIAKHRSATPDILRKAVRGDLDWIVMKSLEKNRNRRYDTANALALDIQRHLDDEPVLAHAPGRMYSLQKFLRRNRIQTVGVLVLLGFVVAVTIALYMWNQTQRQRGEIELSKDTKILSDAREAYVRGNPNFALATVEPILNNRYIGSEARLLHAQLVLDLHGPNTAVQELETLLNEPEEIPKEIAGKAHFILAKIYYDGDPYAPGRTEEYYVKWKYHNEQAKLLLPPNADAYLLQAISAGTVHKTRELLNQALQVDSRHYDSLMERAFLSYVGRDFLGASMDASVMIAIRPDRALGYSLCAMALRELGQYEEAIEYHNEAIERAPDEPEFYDQRQRTYIQMGQYEKALQDARTCVRLDPNENINPFNVFCDLTALGRYDEARTLYDEMVSSGEPEWRLGVFAAKHIFDNLHAGRAWHSAEGPPIGAQFWGMRAAADQYPQWATKAKRVAAKGFRSDWSPDGNELAYGCGLPGSAGVAIWNRQTGKTRLLTIPGGDPVWSPDSQYIAYVRNRKVLPVKGITTAQHAQPIDRRLEEVWLVKADGTEDPKFLVRGSWPQWSWHSNRIFFRPPGKVGRLHSISPDGLDVKPLMLCPSEHPVISPDDRYVAYSKQNYIHVRDIASGKLVAHWFAPVRVRSMELSWSPDGQALGIGIGGANIFSQGFWIYDLKQKTAIQVLGGSCGVSCWSEPELGQISIQRSSYGNIYYEIWTAAIAELLPGKTIAEHAQEAIDFYTDLIEDDHEDLLVYVSRAAFHIYMNDVESAFTDLKLYESLAENPSEKVNAYFWLGWYLCHVPQKRVDPEIAVKLLERAYVLKSDPKNEWIVGVLGIVHYRAGHWKDAIDWIGRAIKMSPNGGVNYYAFIMAMAYWQAGDKDQARICYEKTVAWMSNRITEGNAPSQEDWQPAWCFYMEAAELMGLETELFDDEAPTTGRQQPFQQDVNPQSMVRTIEDKNRKEVKLVLTENR